MIVRPLRRLGPCLAACLLMGPASAQWTDDPAVNLLVSDAASGQAQPQVVATDDGGCWVSWLDGIASGWDVRVQRLDIGGVPRLPTGGVLVADRGFSSTQDYGLDVDADGHALLAYRDDSGSGVQIGAARVEPDGTLSWGAGGVQLTATSAFLAAPEIAGTADGRALVAWTQDSSVVLRRLDAAGAIVPGSALAFTPATGSYSLSDMHAVGDDVIVAFVHQTGGFGSPRRLVTQKIGADGSLLWGAGHVPVFSSGSLQFGNFPDFVTDADGGAIFAWYDTSSPQLQVYVQRILHDGSEGFATDGVPVSLNASRVRVSPSVGYEADTDEVAVYWIEQSSNQSLDGIYGQRFDAAGTRLWTSDGLAIQPLGLDIGSVRMVVQEDRDLVLWDRVTASGSSDDTLQGVMVGGFGLVTNGPFDVCSVVSAKSRPALARSTAGQGVVVWEDDRADDGDLHAQNINEGGLLGTTWRDLQGGTVGVDGQPVLSGFGPLWSQSPFGITLDYAPPSSFVLLWLSLASTPLPFFGGVLHGLPQSLELILVSDPDGHVELSAPFPTGLPAGTSLVFQFLCQDGTVFFGKTLSNGLEALASGL